MPLGTMAAACLIQTPTLTDLFGAIGDHLPIRIIANGQRAYFTVLVGGKGELPIVLCVKRGLGDRKQIRFLPANIKRQLVSLSSDCDRKIGRLIGAREAVEL